eukprot:6180125-Pleurochrysis_carterae.AAC.1
MQIAVVLKSLQERTVVRIDLACVRLALLCAPCESVVAHALHSTLCATRACNVEHADARPSPEIVHLVHLGVARGITRMRCGSCTRQKSIMGCNLKRANTKTLRSNTTASEVWQPSRAPSRAEDEIGRDSK